MRIDIIGKHRVELFNSIEEMPVERFFTYNRMLLIDSGLGADFTAVDAHITKAIQYMVNGQTEEARQELINMRNAVYFVFDGLNPKYLSYAALVYKIDGHQVHDITDEALRDRVKTFSTWGAKKGFLDQAIEAIKKKRRTN